MTDLLISCKDPTGDITPTITAPVFGGVSSVTCILIPSGSDIFTTSILCPGLANSGVYPGIGIFRLFDGTVTGNFVFSIVETAVTITETACTNDTTTISGPTTPGFTATTKTYLNTVTVNSEVDATDSAVARVTVAGSCSVTATSTTSTLGVTSTSILSSHSVLSGTLQLLVRYLRVQISSLQVSPLRLFPLPASFLRASYLPAQVACQLMFKEQLSRLLTVSILHTAARFLPQGQPPLTHPPVRNT